MRSVGLLLSVAVCFPLWGHARGLEFDHTFRVVAPTRYPLVCDATALKLMLDLKTKIDNGQTLSEEQETELRKTLTNLDESCLGKDIKKDLAAAFRRLKQFPCDTSKITEPITIVVSPELHAQEHEEQLAKYNRNVVANIFKLVREGTAMAAFETNLEGNFATPEERTSGMVDISADTRDAYAIIGMFHINHNSDTKRVSILDVVHAISQNEIISTAWNAVKRPFADQKVEKDAAQIDKLIPPFSSAFEKWKQESDRKDLEALISNEDRNLEWNAGRIVSFEILKNSIETMASKEKRFAAIPPEITGDFSQQNLDKNFKLFFTEVLVKWRDRHMVGSVSELVCRAIKSGARTVFLRQGGYHAPGSIELLNSFIGRSDAQNKIEIKVDKSFDRSPVGRLLEVGRFQGIDPEIISVWRSLKKYPRWEPRLP